MNTPPRPIAQTPNDTHELCSFRWLRRVVPLLVRTTTRFPFPHELFPSSHTHCLCLTTRVWNRFKHSFSGYMILLMIKKPLVDFGYLRSCVTIPPWWHTECHLCVYFSKSGVNAKETLRGTYFSDLNFQLLQILYRFCGHWTQVCTMTPIC